MAQNVRPWRPDFADRQPVDPPPKDAERARTLVRTGDLLITIVGANTGDVCLVTQALADHFVCQSVALLRPTLQVFGWHLVSYLNADAGGGGRLKTLAYGQGRPHLGFDELRRLAVPLAGLSELRELGRKVEESLAALDPQVLRLVGLIDRLSFLDTAALAKAFRGELVPQDPNDEPAEVLLERLRQQRSSDAPPEKRARRRSSGDQQRA
jgi:type I restriction enzyme, S subunit